MLKQRELSNKPLNLIYSSQKMHKFWNHSLYFHHMLCVSLQLGPCARWLNVKGDSFDFTHCCPQSSMCVFIPVMPAGIISEMGRRWHLCIQHEIIWHRWTIIKMWVFIVLKVDGMGLWCNDQRWYPNRLNEANDILIYHHKETHAHKQTHSHSQSHTQNTSSSSQPQDRKASSREQMPGSSNDTNTNN